MPTLEHEQAIAEYWNTVKDKYPNLQPIDFERICKAPFVFIKKHIRSTGFPVIMVKYFGKFRVTSGRIKKYMKKNDDLHRLGYKDDQEHKKDNDDFSKLLKEIFEYEKRENEELVGWGNRSPRPI